MSNVLRRRSIEASIAQSEEPERKLKRNLGPFNLIVLGISVVIGAGIFSKAANVSATQSGPAVVISFVIAGVICGLSALCYAEFASHIPVAGSAYTFSYASMGELVAWIIGWDLILEMFFAASVVVKAWGEYLDNFFQVFGWQTVDSNGTVHGIHNTISIFGVKCDIFDILLVAVLTALLIFGTKLSANFTGVLTCIKVGIVLLIIVAGFFFFKSANLTPFVPAAEHTSSGGFSFTQTLFSVISGQSSSTYGMFGILAGAGTVFFAFIGFDVVATAAEETRNPRKNVPIGIFGGLGICTVLYILVSLVLSGMATPLQLAQHACTSQGGILQAVAGTQLSGASPCIVDGSSIGSGGANATIIDAFQINNVTWPTKIITVGILVGLTTVVMVLILGAIRVLFAMSRDGLLPRSLSKTSPRFGTPWIIGIIIGVVVAVSAAFFPVDVLGNMVNIGTLSAFVLVSFGVPILRRRRKNSPHQRSEGFQCPGSPVIPIISGLACIWLMLQLDVETWIRFAVWLAIGFIIYFSFSYRNSQLQKHPEDVAVDYSRAVAGMVLSDVEVRPDDPDSYANRARGGSTQNGSDRADSPGDHDRE